LELGTKRSAHAPKTKYNVCKLQVIYFEYGFISDTTENMRLSISVLEIIIAQSLAVLMYELEKQNKTFENERYSCFDEGCMSLATGNMKSSIKMKRTICT
jgi:hypothetical protein